MSSDLGITVGPPYTTIQEALDDLIRLETEFRAAEDRRAVFVTTYAIITARLQVWVNNRRFHDNEWVTSYVICFANLYREALENHLAGRLDLLAPAWKISFETSAAGEALVIQDLILGVSAHIN